MSFNPGNQTYLLNEKLMSLSGDMWIDDQAGNHLFFVDGKAFTVRRTLVLQSPDGAELYEVNQSLAHLHQTFEVKRAGVIVAVIQKAMINFLGDHFSVAMADGSTLAVEGNWINREFHISRDGTDVIIASRAWFSIRDTYGIQVLGGLEVPLALAVVIALEQMERLGREHRNSGFGLNFGN